MIDDAPQLDMGLPARLPFRRVLVVGTGAIGVAFLPALVSSLVWHYRTQVTVALTEAAGRLVSAESLSAISRQPVAGPHWPSNASGGAEHVRLAEWAEAVIVWPATLDFCARVAYGLTSDVASATVAAAGCPVLVAPSLSHRAAQGPAYRRARDLLVEAGYSIVGPTTGRGLTDATPSMGACVSVAAVLAAAAQLTPPANSSVPGSVAASSSPTTVEDRR